ncbi:hypothetical protein ACIGQE_28345 [Streptomyces sp. NPDC053429]|uniref:hypothetical protein n=1 Tax=Streptomyces sp. NPDC053429 TaxID=3365702 RepID=UPI0037D468F6
MSREDLGMVDELSVTEAATMSSEKLFPRRSEHGAQFVSGGADLEEQVRRPFQLAHASLGRAGGER